MKKRELIALLVLLMIDLISKSYIASTMQLGESIPVINDFFYITYAHNTGAAWSMLEGQMLFFYVTTIAGVVLISWLFFKSDKQNTYTRFALVLMLVGAVGNFIDRVLYQYVRDFLDFHIFGYDFPIFNVADMCLCIGVFVIILLMVFKKENIDELL